MISVNLPPKADLEEVTGFLNEQAGLQWEYADPRHDEVDSEGQAG
jgi:hypothetical protein